MRRLALALVLGTLVFAAGLAIAGCGDEEEATPTPDTITGTLTDTTDTTETDETETETDTTETTDTTDTGGGAVEGDPVAGKEVFLGAGGCGSCHTFADAGTSGSIGPNLDDSQPSFELAVDRVTNGQGAMPSFEGQLTEQQIADVAAYVSGG
jgi:mono/diheme cytochrome c family protein